MMAFKPNPVRGKDIQEYVNTELRRVEEFIGCLAENVRQHESMLGKDTVGGQIGMQRDNMKVNAARKYVDALHLRAKDLRIQSPQFGEKKAKIAWCTILVALVLFLVFFIILLILIF